MIKTLEVDAPLEVLNRLEASGLPCKWTGEVMEVTLDSDSADDLLKIGHVFNEYKGKVTFKCTKMQVGDKTLHQEDMKNLIKIARENHGTHTDP